MVGIYMIKNLINGKKYYGSSKNIEKRWKNHLNKLIKNKHENCKLQRAWNKYGQEHFEFKVIELTSIEELLLTEQKYLNENPEYNIGKHASGGDNLSQNPNKKEIIQKISKSTVKKHNSMSKEEKKSRYEYLNGEKNPNWRGGTSKKYCKCGKSISPNNTTCRNCMDNSGEKNPFYGKTWSKEHKEYLSNLFKNKEVFNSRCVEITINGVDYKSYSAAAKVLNINQLTLRHRVLSKNPKYKDYNIKGIVKECLTKEEQKAKFAEKHIGKKRPHNKPFFIDDVEYRTLTEASNILKIHRMTIKQRLLSNKFPNYKYKN